MTAKEFSAALRKAREMTATGVAASRYADEIRCRMAGIPVAPPLPSGLYDEGFVRMHGTARAAGHNPHGLTVAQVGVGWRLLAKEEIIKERRLHGGDRYAIEAWTGGWDTTGWAGNEATYTYRTQQPPGFFLPKEEPFESELRKIAKKRGPGTWDDIAEAWRKAEAELGKKIEATSPPDAEATPPPAGTKYVHTFVCNACPRTCTMETESAAPGPLVPGIFDMQCPFRRPEFVSLWEAGPVHTLTP